MKRVTKILLAAAALVALVALPAALARGGDRDDDKLPDKWENQNGLSTKKDDAGKDPDGDRLSNKREFRFALDPRDKDSDDDGVKDSKEHAGVVKSFENGVLTIDLAAGGSVSGKVTDRTEIECEDRAEHADDDEQGEHQNGQKDDGDDDDRDDGDRDDDDRDDGDRDDDDRDDGDRDDDDRGSASHDGDDDEQGDKDDDEQKCSVADLKPGTAVHEADLELTSAGAAFEEVELIK